jgi:hypothetical protein
MRDSARAAKASIKKAKSLTTFGREQKDNPKDARASGRM